MIVTVQFDPSQADDAAKLGLLFGAAPTATVEPPAESASEPAKPKRGKRKPKAEKESEAEPADTAAAAPAESAPAVTLETVGAKFKECQAKDQAGTGELMKSFLEKNNSKTVRDLDASVYPQLIEAFDRFLAGDGGNDDSESFGF